MATWLPVQADDRERSCSLRMQALSASTHVTRSAPVVELICQHTDDRLLVHGSQSRVTRSNAEEVPQKAASSEKVEMVVLPS